MNDSFELIFYRFFLNLANGVGTKLKGNVTMIKTYAIILTLFIASNGFSQGIYLNQNESGLGAVVGTSFFKEGFTNSITLGFSYKGIFDISFDYGKPDLSTPVSNKPSKSITEASIISSSVTFYPNRYDSTNTFGSITLGYGETNFSGPDIGDNIISGINLVVSPI